MVRIKFTSRPRAPTVSPKFGSMASAEHREISTEQLEESQGGQQVVFLTESASEKGARSDQENQSDGSGGDETTSDNDGHVKIGDEAALASISYDFGKLGVTKARIASLEGIAHYFLKGYG
jgi:hypothetical protein